MAYDQLKPWQRKEALADLKLYRRLRDEAASRAKTAAYDWQRQSELDSAHHFQTRAKGYREALHMLNGDKWHQWRKR